MNDIPLFYALGCIIKSPFLVIYQLNEQLGFWMASYKKSLPFDATESPGTHDEQISIQLLNHFAYLLSWIADRHFSLYTHLP